MAAVHKLKYGGKTGLAGPLGMLLLSAFAKWFDPAGVDLVVPVPLHRHKFRRRGFNQAYLLIRQWHRQAQALALVALYKALGGGWSATELSRAGVAEERGGRIAASAGSSPGERGER